MEQKVNPVDSTQAQIDPVQMDFTEMAQAQMDEQHYSHGQVNLGSMDLACLGQQKGMNHGHIDLGKMDHVRMAHTSLDMARMNHVGTGQTNLDLVRMDEMKESKLQQNQQKMNHEKSIEMEIDDVQKNLAKIVDAKQGQVEVGTPPLGGTEQGQIQTPQVIDHEPVEPQKADHGSLDHTQPDSVQKDQMKVGQAQGVKRKRVVWDIPTKLKILERLGNGERAVDLAREYGVGRSTISDMKSTESKLREFLSNSNNDSRSRCTMKLSADENLDRLLYTWFLEERNKGTHLSGPIIRDKAKWFHRQLHPGDETFAASQGWLRRWKERHGVTGSVFNLFMGGTKCPGRRSRILDIPAKLEIIERLDNGEQIPDLAKEYGVGKTTIAAVMSAKAKLMVYQVQNDPSKAEKYMTKFACYENVDKALYTWYVEEKNKGTPLSGPVVKEKAKWFHDTMYPGNNFKASEGWLWRWKKRNGINGPIGNNSAGNNPEGEDAEGVIGSVQIDCGENSADPATKIKAIESTLAKIKSEETKLRKRIYKRRKGKEDLSQTVVKGDGENVKGKATPDGKRKRVVLDIPTKLKIIERVNNGERPVDLAREFGLGRSTITDIKLSEARLKTFMSTADSGTCKRQTMRQPTYESVDKALYSWYVEESKKGTPLPGNVLRDRARLLHSQLYPDDSPFLASEGWLRRWKERHGLCPPTRPTKGGQKHGERKKRVVLNVMTKLKIIDRLHKGENPNHLAKEYGVSKTTINDIKAAEDKLKEYVASCGKSATKRNYTLQQCHAALNKAMYIWFLQERSKGSNLSWPELEARAIWFHSQLHPDCNVMVSTNRWLGQWKSCYSIGQLSPQTEISPGLCQATELFKKHLAAWMLETDMGPEQLYSAEESTLYWNLLPSKALSCASESDVLEYHRLQDHVTLLTCTNSSGSHKLPVLLVGKSDDPECLKLLDMTNLSVEYSAQKNGLMSPAIFSNWFHTRFVPEVQRHLESRGLPLKAALLVRHCPAHVPSLEVETADGRIECVFLPMSSSSRLNPMNQGTIDYLKHTFRKTLVHKLISLRSSLTDIFRNLSLCDCILLIDAAWRAVTKQHILKSWERSTLMQCFPNTGPIPELSEAFDVDTVGLSVIQEAFGTWLSKDDIHEWLNCDHQANPCEQISDSDILGYVKSLPVQEEPVASQGAGTSAALKTNLHMPETVYIKQENVDESYIGYSDSQKNHTVSNSDTEEFQYSDPGSDSQDSRSSHVVKYFSFSQSEENVDDTMPEDSSETVQTDPEGFEKTLMSIKEEPLDYESDSSEGQNLSDQDYDPRMNSSLEDDSDLTEDEALNQTHPLSLHRNVNKEAGQTKFANN